MAIIKAPNKDYNGISAGVTFINGIGETYSPHLVDWFREHGYKVETTETPLESKPAVKPEVWAQEDPKETWVPEEKPKPKRQTKRRGGK